MHVVSSQNRQLRMAELRARITTLSLRETALREAADDVSRERYKLERELLAMVKGVKS
jgi:hypothetical protein